jgi:hypothetical protein
VLALPFQAGHPAVECGDEFAQVVHEGRVR